MSWITSKVITKKLQLDIFTTLFQHAVQNNQVNILYRHHPFPTLGK